MSEKMDENTETLYWAMLMEIESKTRENDALGKHLVESAYRHWNTMHPENKPMLPRWLRKD